MYNAREVDASSAPQFYRMVEELAQRANLPMPRVYIIQEDAPNAFATGRNPQNGRGRRHHRHHAGAERARVARRDGARAGPCEAPRHPDLDQSAPRWPVRSRCWPTSRCSFGGRDSEGRPANPIVSIAVMLLAPLAASVIQMAISRAREFEADRGRRRDLRRPAGPGQCAGQDSPLRPRHSDGGRRATPGNRADDDHESAVRRRAARAVLDPPGDRGAVSPALMADGAHRLTAHRPARALKLRRAVPIGRQYSGTAMTRLPLYVLVAAASLLAGCDMLGIESPEKIAAVRDADGRAIGGGLPACRPRDRGLLPAQQEGRPRPPSSPAGAR